jgi:hypothetical protein
MKNNLSLFLFFLIAVSSCTTKYSFWPVSKFHMDENALAESEKVKVIYTTRGEGENTDAYVHIIVISKESGDTVNVLTSIDNDFKQEDSDKSFIYTSRFTDFGKIFSMRVDKLKELHNLDTLKNIQPASYSKVLRDPKFDFLADNNFPTVIGFIGEEILADTAKTN